MPKAAPTKASECKYCAAKLRPRARYCTECRRFQGFWGRITGEVNLAILIALVPVLTVAWTYLNRMVVPYSRLSATVLHCSRDEVTTALNNTGTRDAIVAGGSATFAPAKPDYNRYLNPPGADYKPVVVGAGKAIVARFAFSEAGTFLPVPAPELQAPETCAYQISFSVVEFGGRRQSVPAGECQC